MSTKVLAIGPHSPPITGPGLKNRYLREGLSDRGFEICWINTLETSPKTIVRILQKTMTYDAYILSASTKVRLFIAPVLATKLQSPDVCGALFPAGGEFANELNALPSYVREFYIRTFSLFNGIYPEADELTTDLQEIFGDKTHIRTVPNLRPLPDSTPVGSERHTGNSQTLELVYVGRIKESKGLDDLLDAFEQTKTSGIDVSLDVYGHFLPDDPYEDHFRNKCRNISGATFEGKIPDGAVIQTLQNYDSFVFPSFYDGEGIPGALIEAFAAGCPIVATDWNYNGEMITDGVDGRLYEPQNVDELAKHIQWLAQHPAERKEMQQNAYETAKRYSVEEVTEMILTYFAESGWEISASDTNAQKLERPHSRV